MVTFLDLITLYLVVITAYLFCFGVWLVVARDRASAEVFLLSFLAVCVSLFFGVYVGVTPNVRHNLCLHVVLDGLILMGP